MRIKNSGIFNNDNQEYFKRLNDNYDFFSLFFSQVHMQRGYLSLRCVTSLVSVCVMCVRVTRLVSVCYVCVRDRSGFCV